MATRARLRTMGTITPFDSDWDEEQRTCKGCDAAIYGTGECCTGSADRSPAAFATTASANGVRHGA